MVRLYSWQGLRAVGVSLTMATAVLRGTSAAALGLPLVSGYICLS